MTIQQRSPPATAVAVTGPPPPPPIIVNVSRGGGDDRYTRAPEPLRWYDGGDSSYQSFGVITTEDGQQLPLYGRRTLSKSDRYNYYTRTDTYNPIPIPLRYKGKDCQDSIGCEELMNKEAVQLATGKGGQVQMYNYGENIYNPFSV